MFHFVLIASCPGTRHHKEDSSSILFASLRWSLITFFSLWSSRWSSWAFSPASWTVQTPSAIPHWRDSPVSWSSSWPSTGLSPLYSCFSFTEELRMWQSTPGVASPTLSRGEGLPSLTSILLQMQMKIMSASFTARAHCWLTFNWCPPEHSGSFLQSYFTVECLWNVWMPGVIPQVQNFVLLLVNFIWGSRQPISPDSPNPFE